MSNRIALRKAMPMPPVAVWADTRRLRQVWINLFSNAVKFTPEGGWVEVVVEWQPGGGIAVRVSDSGIGIAEEDIERVQQPFSQVASALSRGHEGTGLGLSLSRSLIELHGGSLDLDSRLGEGTTVTVSLPAERCRRNPLAGAQHQLANSAAAGEGLQGQGSAFEPIRPADLRSHLAAD
jgi:signal transduction histidine kinase